MRSAGEPIAGLHIHLRKEIRGPIVATEAVMPRDLADAMAELGFVAGLRRGRPQLDIGRLRALLRPVHRDSRSTGRTCVGFTLEVEASPGERTRCRFDRAALELVATRGSRRLIDRGLLSEGELYFFEIDAHESEVGPIEIEGEAPPPTPDAAALAPLLARARLVDANRAQGLADEAYSRRQRDPTGSARVKLASEVEGAKPVDDDAGALVDRPFPLFYTEAAFAKAERIARQGGFRNPPVEAGGLLLGRIQWCDASRTLSLLVDDALEASGAEGTVDALTFMGVTWRRAQVILRARQRTDRYRTQRVLGSFHSHPFLPYDVGATCDGCPSQGSCRLTTAFLSEADRRWSRAVFPRQPWQIAQIFGLTPRREPVSALYGQRGGLLERREYHLIDQPDAPR